MWMIDIRHWLNEQKDGPAVPQLKLKVRKLAEIIAYATLCDRGLYTGKAPRCWRRPKRKPCKGILQIQFEIDGRIHWFCPECADEGLRSCPQTKKWKQNFTFFTFLLILLLNVNFLSKKKCDQYRGECDGLEWHKN